MDTRLPAHLEIAGLIRAVEAKGGFATVLAKGEKDAGTILIVTLARDGSQSLYERMPQMNGTRSFEKTKIQVPEMKAEFAEYLTRRKHQDDDIWILEVDIAQAERFVASLDA